MSEESAVQAPAQEIAAVSPVAQQQAPVIKKEISDALSALAGLKGKAINELKEEAVKSAQLPTPAAPTPKLTPEGKSEAQILTEQANKAAASPEPATGIPAVPVGQIEKAPEAPIKNPTTGIEIDNPLLGGKKTFGETPAEPVQSKFESIDAINDYITSNHEGVKDINSLFENYTNQSAEIQDLSKNKESLGQINELLSKLPTDLHNALSSFERGEEWRDGLLNAARIDFGKEAKDIDKQVMVNNYFPGEISQSDWEEYNSEDASPHLKRLVDGKVNDSVNAFNAGKDERNGMAQKAFDVQEKRNKSFHDSVSVSIEKLKETHPEMHENTVATIQQSLSNNSILDHFYDKAGNLLPEAASLKALLEHGPALIDQLKIKLTEKAESKANLDTLNRGNQVPNKVGSDPTNQKTDVRPGFLEDLEKMKTGLNKPKNLFI